MIELPAMDPCPCGKRGRHALAAVFPADADMDMTLFCERCGMVRRLPMTGAPLSSLSVDDIASRIGAWEVR